MSGKIKKRSVLLQEETAWTQNRALQILTLGDSNHHRKAQYIY